MEGSSTQSEHSDTSSSVRSQQPKPPSHFWSIFTQTSTLYIEHLKRWSAVQLLHKEGELFEKSKQPWSHRPSQTFDVDIHCKPSAQAYKPFVHGEEQTLERTTSHAQRWNRQAEGGWENDLSRAGRIILPQSLAPGPSASARSVFGLAISVFGLAMSEFGLSHPSLRPQPCQCSASAI